MMQAVETFKALGDPIRMKMIQRLAEGSQYTVGSLSDGLGLTRQGARKHLQLLADVKLVYLQINGRQTEVRLNADSLAAAKSFISELEHQWDKRLLALRDFVEDNTASKSSL